MTKTKDDFQRIVDATKLPFGWELHLREAIGYLYLQVGDSAARCNVTGKAMAWTGRKWLLSEHMTDGEVVQTAFLATMTAMEHEAREVFSYRGRAIFDPHYDIEKLVELRAQPDALKERAATMAVNNAKETLINRPRRHRSFLEQHQPHAANCGCHYCT